jgi:hypothetical protein
VLSILDGSGTAALGIHIDWRGNRTGLSGFRDASRENRVEVRGSINTGPEEERKVYGITVSVNIYLPLELATNVK